MKILADTRATFEMIKWEHSVFALPFAATAAVLAARGVPTLWAAAWILVCMVAARSAAMAFNRLVDSDIDSRNPRTAARAIPAGILSRGFVAAFVALLCALFVLGAYELNRLTFLLSPVALAIVLGYSYTKRFTAFSHLVLGASLGIAPAAAWIAVRGTLDARILWLSAAVCVWVAGFDTIYACQDADFDARSSLRSVPQRWGIARALHISRGLHLLTVLALLVVVKVFALGALSWAGVAVVALLLAYEHSLVRPDDLSRLDAAFFTMNGIIALIFASFAILDVVVMRTKISYP